MRHIYISKFPTKIMRRLIRTLILKIFLDCLFTKVNNSLIQLLLKKLGTERGVKIYRRLT